jgi:hypothetical protein
VITTETQAVGARTPARPARLALRCARAGEQPVTFSSPASYAVGGLGPEASQTTQWPHGLGEIVTAAAAAGLRVESLTEWFDEAKDPKLVTGPDGRARFPVGGEHLPTSYALRARRPEP